MSGASARIRWSVDQLDVEPDDRLLEIGCGHGVAVSLVCDRLDGGTIHAIDRSPKMIATATARNARHISRGVASFATGDLGKADLGDRRFDKVFAIRVPVFVRGQPADELEIIRKRLGRDGRLFLVEQPLSTDAVPGLAEHFRELLEANGYRLTGLRTVLGGTPRVCAIAQPAL